MSDEAMRDAAGAGMQDGGEMPPTPRRWRPRWRHAGYAVVFLVVLFLLAVGAAVWYGSTPQFSARVRKTLVATLERATGGRVEIGGFHWSVWRLAVQVDDLTIHGKEGPGEAPYFHVQRLDIDAKILSFLAPAIALDSLEAQAPEFHLIVYPDGTTNQPKPKTSGTVSLPQVLLRLAIDRTRIRDGEILINDRKLPWELASGPLQLTMRYDGEDAGYKAELEADNLTFRLKNAEEARSRLRAEIGLNAGTATVKSLELETGKSRLTVTGSLDDFLNPSWRVNVDGTVDARQVGAMTGEEELRNGTVQLRLRAQGDPDPDYGEKFEVNGHVDLQSGEWESTWLRLKNVELHTDLVVDDDQCSLTGFSSLLDDGGRITGSLVMRHCIGPSKPETREATVRAAAWPEGRNAARRTGLSPRELLRRLHAARTPAKPRQRGWRYQPLEADMRAQVAGVTLPLILAATAPRPYWNIGFTTATYGEVTGKWTGDGDGLDIHGNLTMRVPQKTLGLIPVTGSAHADYLGDHHHLVIQQADEHTPATDVHADGLLTLYENDLKSALNLNVTGRNLAEFDRLLTTLDLRATAKGEPHALPVELMGSASFRGQVRGSFFALQAFGHMDAEQFQMVAARTPAPGSTASPGEHRLSWDAFHGDLAYTAWHLAVHHAELVRGNTTIHTSFDLSPERTGRNTYQYNRRTQMTVRLQANAASIADLQSVTGSAYPVAGDVTANLQVTGTVDDLDGAGHLSLMDGVVDGQAVPSAAMQLAVQGHVVQVYGLRVAAAGGTASGQATYDYETDAITGDVTGQHFALQQVAALKTVQPAVGGVAGFHAQASGTVASPVVQAAVQVANVTMDGEPMGRLNAVGHLQNGTLNVTSGADLLQTHVQAEGRVTLNGEYPAEAKLVFAGFNFEPFLRFTHWSGVGGTSSLDGTVTLSGPLKRLSGLEANADIQAFTATVNGRKIQSVGPVKISMQGGLVRLAQFHVQGADADLTATGTIDVLHGDRLRLQSAGSIDAAFAQVLYPNLQSSGQLRFALNARGTVKQPDLRGRAEVNHVNVHMQNVTNGLTDMNGTMVFDQDRLVVQRLEGYSGGGKLQMTGFVGYRNGIFVDLTTTTQDVRIRYPKGVSSSVNAKLRLQGTSDSAMLSGSVRLVRFGIGSNIDLAALAGPSGVSAPVDPTSPLNRVRLDVHVTSAPELGFQNSFASLAGDVNLRVRGTLENPSVLGRIDITEGSASFAGTNYKLQQGDITFSNPVTISPQIDLEATARVQNYDIIISLHGPPSKLDISYRSEPPLTQADVLALLALGRTNEQATMYGEQTQQAGTNYTSEALLGGALNAAVSSRVQKLFGVGSVRVDPNFVGALGESTARVTVEEQVGQNITLTFATNVNTTAQQLIQAQYDLTRTVSIIAVRDEADVFSMYLQIRGKHK